MAESRRWMSTRCRCTLGTSEDKEQQSTLLRCEVVGGLDENVGGTLCG